MAVIRKKTWPGYFDAVLSGKKKYDLRINDFEVAEGDILVLEEWDPHVKAYTGRTIEKRVTYIGRFRTDEMFWPEEDIKEKGLIVMSLE